MYRQYENPRALEDELEKKREAYNICKEKYFAGEMSHEELYDYYIEIKELEDRVNFAWQDEEFESNYFAENIYDDITPYDEAVSFA